MNQKYIISAISKATTHWMSQNTEEVIAKKVEAFFDEQFNRLIWVSVGITEKWGNPEITNKETFNSVFGAMITKHIGQLFSESNTNNLKIKPKLLKVIENNIETALEHAVHNQTRKLTDKQQEVFEREFEKACEMLSAKKVEDALKLIKGG
jgi:hypothetical protein